MDFKAKINYFDPNLNRMVRKGEVVNLNPEDAPGHHIVVPVANLPESKGGSEASIGRVFADFFDGTPTRSQLESTTNDNLRKVADAMGVEIPSGAVKADMVEAIEENLNR